MHKQDPVLNAIPFIKEELNYEVKDGIVFVKFVQENKIQKLFDFVKSLNILKL